MSSPNGPRNLANWESGEPKQNVMCDVCILENEFMIERSPKADDIIVTS